MTTEDIAVTLEGHGHEIKSLKHRMDAVERTQETLNKLATAVEVMAAEQKSQSETMQDIKKDVTALGTKVDVIEAKPGKRWDKLAETVLACIATAVAAYLLGRVGL